MSKITELQFANMIVSVQMALNCEPMSKERIQIYYDFLGEYDVKQINYAATHLIKYHKYPIFPLIAAFIEAINIFNDSREEKLRKYLIEASKP